MENGKARPHSGSLNEGEKSDNSKRSRRDFLKTSTAATLGTTLTAHLGAIPGAYASGSDTIKVGLIGCGGRGTGAAFNALNAGPGVKIMALGDVFKDRLDECRTRLLKNASDKLDLPPDRCFVGFDAFEKVIASDVNYIILASPPAFRPQHLKAAAAAGKHIFTEKPVAVDGPGIRTVLAVYEEAKAKGLGIAAGTQRRHQIGYLEAMRMIHEGAIGDIVGARVYWNQGGLWKKDRQRGWSDLEWQMRNWLYFTWLSGDIIVEQHIHNIDVANWAMNAHPVKALGTGGRQARTDRAYGHIYDHFAIDYEYENGVHMLSMCRQQDGTDKNISEHIIGTKGTCETQSSMLYTIKTGSVWRFPRDKDNEPYLQEHVDLIASIRAGKPINELKTVSESTLTAIMGRMSAYTGKVITWEQALNSNESLVPQRLEWGPMPVPPVAIPGQPAAIPAAEARQS
ncbi:MAG TPA: Gfo/Idh/MocA family oxidoreductase [Blastocatellia bacterium]|nr:Gfo/Idh/MocA family oxidoreductase [Blastocatellia bacterium]